MPYFLIDIIRFDGRLLKFLGGGGGGGGAFGTRHLYFAI